MASQAKSETRKASAKSKKRRTKGDEDLFVVGIGASAGGLEALRPLVAGLPKRSNMAYVIVQHLSPQHRSMLVQLLARETELIIVEISDGMKVEPDGIYIAPPNKDVLIKGGALWLREPSAPVGPKPSVDAFFVSLAEDMGENAIGVILSGTGTDGAHGIRALKANTGFTVAQDPECAKYDGMPKAAIETGCIDLLLTPEEMGSELASLAKFPRTVVQKSAETAQRSTVEEIFQLVRKKTDIDFSQYKPTTIRRRLERRLAANRIETVEAYLDFVRRNPPELDLLCKDILISVTSFFRDTKAFKDLEGVLEGVVKTKKPGDSIRIWVPGCATGEEAYSIAMMLLERLGKAINDYNVQVFATDIDNDAMAHARKGLYSETIVENLDRALLGRYFDQMAQLYQVKKSVRELVVFARQDLCKDPPFVRIDLVSCRNVLIYFNADLQDRVMKVFHYALMPEGYLFLGKSESVGRHTDLFRSVKSSSKIFRKRMGADRLTTPLFGQFRPQLPRTETDPGTGREISVEELARDAFIDAYAPPSVVVNDNLDILHFHGDVTGFVTLPQGKPNLNLGKLITDEFRTDLRVLTHRCRRDGVPATGGRKMAQIAGEQVPVRLVVHSLRQGPVGDPLFLVARETLPAVPSADMAERGEGDPDADVRIAELEQELVATRENLQTVVEELETSNEELQALNEEMQAANEELQSSNEELETSNEELQSTNEELTTVNEELQTRTAELSEANSDLINIQNTIGFPMIVLDKIFRITRYTPPAVRLFGLLPSDIGQQLSAVPSHADLKDLRAKLKKVVTTGKAIEDEIGADGCIYRMRIVPYRDADERPEGAILAFVDETEIRNAQRQISESEAWIRYVTDSVPVQITYVDAEERFRFCNKTFCDWHGRERNTVIGRKVATVMGPKGYRRIKEQVARALAGHECAFDMPLEKVDGGSREVQTLFRPQVGDGGEIVGFFAIQTDIEPLKQKERELRAARDSAENANRAKSEFLACMSHELRTPLNAILGFSELIAGGTPAATDPDKCREYARDVHDSGRILLDLINDVLDLAKVESGKIELQEEDLDLHVLTAAMEKLVSDRAAKGGLSLRNDVPETFPKLRADGRSLKRVLMNLLSNAVKFTDPGGSVSVSAEDGPEGIRLKVRDDGIGIEPKHLKSILEPFSQIRDPMAHCGDGTGLGLAITVSLLKNHGARLEIDSKPGEGTTAVAVFPPERRV